MKFDKLIEEFLKPKRGLHFGTIGKRNKIIKSKKDLIKKPKYQRFQWKKEEKKYY